MQSRHSVTIVAMLKRLQSFKYAFKGLKVLVRTQPNFRIHLVLAIFAIAAGFVFKINYLEWAIVVLCIGLVFITEAINTSIEFLVDLNTKEILPLASKIKDVSAGAVLIAALVSLVAGGLIFIPKIIAAI
jgi:diacylglycerol kinase (ATP)